MADRQPARWNVGDCVKNRAGITGTVTAVLTNSRTNSDGSPAYRTALKNDPADMIYWRDDRNGERSDTPEQLTRLRIGKRVRDMTPQHLSEQLVGHAIRSVDKETKTITLDSGKTLRFEDTGDCCAWFEAALRTRVDGILPDNVVTSVVCQDLDSSETSERFARGTKEHYVLKVLAGAAGPIAGVEITGDPTSGCYCLSIDMLVQYPDPALDLDYYLGREDPTDDGLDQELEP